MALHDVFLWVALVLSILGLIAHEIVGSPQVLAPLAQAEMPGPVKSLLAFLWHVGSVAVLAMIAMFACAATLDNQMPMGAIASAMSAGLAMLAVAMGLREHKGLWKTPAPYIWTVIAISGFAGVLASGELS